MARLPRLIGRGRALEVLLGADDFDGALAEKYGYVNRAVPDAELDEFVDRLARRIASFDKPAIAETKQFVDALSLPDDAELPPQLDAFRRGAGHPETQARIKKLMQMGFNQDSDLEHRFGEIVVSTAPSE